MFSRSWISHTPDNSYRSYQRFYLINEAKGSFFMVLTLKPHLHVAVNKGGFAYGRNCDNTYSVFFFLICAWLHTCTPLSGPLCKFVFNMFNHVVVNIIIII